MIFECADPSPELQRLSLELLWELGEPVRVECKAKEIKEESAAYDFQEKE